jgi:beta-glucosidase
MRGPAVNRALIAQKLMPADIDERVRKILGLLKRAAASGIPFDAEEKGLDTPEVRTLLREAAGQATVLLKNDRGLLPIKGDSLKGKKIAVLGPNARVAQFSGGGSARLLPTYAVSPLEGITAAAKEVGAEVIFNAGANTHKYVPHAHEYIAFEGKPTTAHMQFWNAAPTEDWLSTSAKVRDDKLPKTAWETTTAISECFLADGVPPEVEEQCWIRYSGVFTPSMDGPWEFGLNVAGRANLYLDGACIIDLSTDPKPGEAFFNLGTEDKTTVVKDMQKGREYAIEVRIANGDFVARGSPFKCWGGLRLGAAPYVEAQKGIEEAAEIAKSADVTILIIGLNQE